MIQCPANHVYAINTKTCVPNKRNGPNGICEKINCSKMDNHFISYSSNPGYYAFCSVPIIMFKCVDEENFLFDIKTNKCRFNCKKSGYFADRLTCGKYFICERAGGEAIEQDCPEDHIFDGKGCVYETNCKPELQA